VSALCGMPCGTVETAGFGTCSVRGTQLLA
jgi:hypothetical protein